MSLSWLLPLDGFQFNFSLRDSQWKRSILSVASKCVHVRQKHVVIGGKHDMFCCQTIEVWSRLEICVKVEENEIWAERADQKHINNLPLARHFALTAVKLQTFGRKTRHVWRPIRSCFFVSCPRLGPVQTSCFCRAELNCNLVRL